MQQVVPRELPPTLISPKVYASVQTIATMFTADDVTITMKVEPWGGTSVVIVVMCSIDIIITNIIK